VIEAAGNAQLMAQTLGLLRRSGVACLLGIDPREQTIELDGPVLGVDTILENRVLFGTVNAQRQDSLAAVADLERAQERWPEALAHFVTLRVPLDRFQEAFEHRGGKATLVLSE
jgi:Zn-dependent alcohol dehydrogenase